MARKEKPKNASIGKFIAVYGHRQYDAPIDVYDTQAEALEVAMGDFDADDGDVFYVYQIVAVKRTKHRKVALEDFVPPTDSDE